MFQAARKARDGGNGREFVYRAIVERHLGKHTGLPPSAKACPKGMRQCKPAARRVTGGRPGVTNSATAPGASSVNPGGLWEFRSSKPGATGRRQKSRRFRQREARE